MENDRETGQDEWVTLQGACRLLGVHPSTLRRWADAGDVPVMVTPGGHRRFRRSDLERFERERRGGPDALSPAGVWAERATAAARQSLAQQQWLAVYGEDDRNVHRRLGHQLLGLILRSVSHAEASTDLLTEAHAIGARFAEVGLEHQQALIDLLRTMSLFRNTMLRSALPAGPESSAGLSGRLLCRMDGLLDEVQIGLVEVYVGHRQF